MNRSQPLKRRTRIRAASPRRTSEKEIKALFRRLVLTRDGYACRKCGRRQGEPTDNGSIVLQCSHIKSQGKYRRLRFVPLNALTLCIGCHLYWWHKEPIEAGLWVAGEIGHDKINNLELMAQTLQPKTDPMAVKLYLEAELAKLERKETVSV